MIGWSVGRLVGCVDVFVCLCPVVVSTQFVKDLVKFFCSLVNQCETWDLTTSNTYPCHCI